MSHSNSTPMRPTQAITSHQVARALGVEHPFLLRRAHLIVDDLCTPAFTSSHFVWVNDRYLLTQIAANLVAIDMGCDHELLSIQRLFESYRYPDDASEELAPEVRSLMRQITTLTRDLHGELVRKRSLQRKYRNTT